MVEDKRTPEEAKFYRDKYVMETAGKNVPMSQATASTNDFWPVKNGVAMGLGVGRENFIKIKEDEASKGLENFKKKIREWLYIDDEEVLDVILAALISEKISGDPLWLFLIAPPGGTKTEILRSFQGEDFCHLSDMTSKTLISGLMIGEGEKRRKVSDLLPELDGRTLIFKDFTTILEKGSEERREIISQFREAYDGLFSKKFGTVDKVIEYKSRFGLIAGVTPVIDKHWKIMQQLGERFLKVRWKVDREEVTYRASEIEGNEKIMRKELALNSEKFLTNLKFDNIPQIEEQEIEEYLIKIAQLIALARTPVSINYSTGEFYHDYIPTPEIPTRLVKQLKKLVRCLALVRGKFNVSINEVMTAARVAKDTIPPDRAAVLEVVSNLQNIIIGGCPRSKVVKSVKMPEPSTRRVIEQLKLLDLLEETRAKENYQEECFYTLRKPYGNIFDTLSKKVGGTKKADDVKDKFG